MVTPVSPIDPRNRVYPGEGFDGVVLVTSGIYAGTGALLFDGRAILTSAHLFSDLGGSTTVSFQTSGGTQTVSALSVLIHPDYDPIQGNNDLALIWLSSAAPVTAERYSPYRDSDEIGQDFTMVGYGDTGTGSSGAVSSGSGSPARVKAKNEFDADAELLKTYLGSGISWTPLAGSQLIADFDDGTNARDALGRLIERPGLGLGLDEGLIAPGDSGGPAFVDGKIAGVAGYTASLSKGLKKPDIDDLSNSSFGEIAAWQRVSFYQQWIDQSMRTAYSDAPQSPEEVITKIPEGDSGTGYAYFLLRFTGVRNDPNQVLSVDYATRDGTAIAFSDYLPVSGTLNLYPSQTQAVIPVEIIGDTTNESDEIFFLDAFNPVGGSFGEGVVKITAVRTILNDDGWTG